MALAAEKGEYLHLIEDLAHHAATAAELVAELGRVPGVPRSLPRHAVHALLKAAQAALDAGRAEHAIRHAGRALALSEDDPVARRQLLLIRATAELDMRQFPAASADARHALESALADGDEITEGEARRRLGTVAHMQGDLATSRRQLDAAVDIFRRAGDDKRLANALRARGFAEVFGGSIPAARTYLGEAMTLFGELGDERGQAWAGHNMAWAAFQGGDFRRRRDAARGVTAALREARRPGRRPLGGGPARLRHVLPAPLRRGRGAGLGGDQRRQALGRHVGAADDADAAGEHAAVDRTHRRGRGAGRAGARRVP